MTPNDFGMNEQDKKILEEFVTTNETAKRIDKNKKKLAEQVKDVFKKYNISSELDYNGYTLTVTDSVRKTIIAGTKDEFIQELVKKNKNYLLLRSIEIDTDTLYSEVENGQIDKNFIEKYMKITPTKTLTCK